MANDIHLEILRQGVEVWNQWRKENPEIKPDLSNIDTTGILDLSHVQSVGYEYVTEEPFDDKYYEGYADLFYDVFSKSKTAPSNLEGVNFSHTNLSGAVFKGAQLGESDLSYADLSGADLSGAFLCGANLSSATLSGARFDGANLTSAQFYQTDLKEVIFGEAKLSLTNLREADLSKVLLNYAELISADLEGAKLCGAVLISANLNLANLTSADLTGATLAMAQALGACFDRAILTGACIEDWNINSRTSLQKVVCEYVFNKDIYENNQSQFTDRRPHNPNQTFAPGEFTKRYQVVLETVDLFFNDGIDWKAFLASMQDLKTQYGEDLNLQGIEKKAGGSFVVRLEVPSDIDKGIVERTAVALYETKLQTLEAYYQERLQLRGEQLDFFKEQVEIERIRNTRLERIVETMAEKESPKYDLRGAKFGGGFAADGGTQTGGTFNDFSQNIEQNINEIGGLIQALRSQAETFPEGVRQETLDHIADLETDIEQPPEKRKPSRIKATLMALAGMATFVGGAVAGANEFATNVQELSEKLGIPLPIEQVQPQAQQSDAIDVKAINSDQP